MTDDNQNTDETKTSDEATVETTVEEKVEEPKAEEPKAEEPKREEPKAEEPKKEAATPKASGAKLSSKLEKIAKEIEGLTALELSELAGYLEEVFGVSAMPMMAASGSASASAEASADKEEKSTYDVVLTDGGANKLAVIKAVREFKPDLGLMDAKKLVETAPQTLLTGAKKDDAESAKKKVEDAGGKVELK